ncbi:hypothetical protein [Nonomuraea basaltis]|uniref:hypothetical protein n=1 Tax=Nonomuraea basaltis TaxID=2495887 RepID=UPI00110C46A0|nr:hypothetical protein [Nonomuraea basaltis]TMR88900.1 hypothetical protein EJK15_63730 [Nonomuraea basaltis]
MASQSSVHQVVQLVLFLYWAARVTAGSITFPVPGGGFTKGGFRHIFNDLGPAVDAGVDSGNSRLTYSDVYGFTANQRIAWFPDSR